MINTLFDKKSSHLLMTDILGPIILLPSASRLPKVPNPPVGFVFILLFVFLRSFLEVMVLFITGGLLPKVIMLFVELTIGFLLTDENLLPVW